MSTEECNRFGEADRRFMESIDICESFDVASEVFFNAMERGALVNQLGHFFEQLIEDCQVIRLFALVVEQIPGLFGEGGLPLLPSRIDLRGADSFRLFKVLGMSVERSIDRRDQGFLKGFF